MRIRIVDAFTDRPFAGNSAAVVLLPDAGAWPDEGWLQQVAAEADLAATAFARPVPDDPAADWALRWFSPVTELALCGHATLAAAHALYRTGAAGAVRFTTRGGVLTTTETGDGAISIELAAAPLERLPDPAVPPAAVLGGQPVSAWSTGPLRDLLVELPDAEAVLGLAPDLAAVARLDNRGLIATARADAGTGRDFVSRCFFPAVGIPEDPVTGSAHTALAPFWSARLGRAELVGFQASTRGGEVRTAVRGDRVRLTGRAVTVIDGELAALPPAPRQDQPVGSQPTLPASSA